MSSSRRKLLQGAGSGLALVLAAGLTGCGFQPLYAKRGNESSTSLDLASVQVDPLPDRVGQQMHNYLRDRLNPHGQPVSPSYRLRVEITESKTEVGVRRDETATRANLRMSVNFSLINYGGDAVLLAGRSTSTTSYDILDNPFASTVSESDARERALREMADDIRTRLAIYFSQS